LVNGPGTSVVLVLVAWIRRFLGLKYTKIIYVESFARTSSLSLSGKLLRPIVDVFVVQWPEAAAAGVGAGVGSTTDHDHDPREKGEKDMGKKVVYKGWMV